MPRGRRVRHRQGCWPRPTVHGSRCLPVRRGAARCGSGPIGSAGRRPRGRSARRDGRTARQSWAAPRRSPPAPSRRVGPRRPRVVARVALELAQPPLSRRCRTARPHLLEQPTRADPQYRRSDARPGRSTVARPGRCRAARRPLAAKTAARMRDRAGGDEEQSEDDHVGRLLSGCVVEKDVEQADGARLVERVVPVAALGRLHARRAAVRHSQERSSRG